MTTHVKRLHRSNKDRILAGVCGGLGEYFEIDPIIIRLIFVLLSLGHGAGVLVYLLFVLVVPKEGAKETSSEHLAQQIKTSAEELKEEVKDLAQEMGEKAKDLAQEAKGGKNWHHGGRNFIGIILVFVGLITLINVVLPFHWLRWDIFWSSMIVLLGLYLIFFKKDKHHHGSC